MSAASASNKTMEREALEPDQGGAVERRQRTRDLPSPC